VLCRCLKSVSETRVAIDGSKFKAVNTPDRNFTQAKIAQLNEKIVALPQEIQRLTVPLSMLGRADEVIE
jgi:hypothetical protein